MTLHKFIWSGNTVLFLSFPIMYSWTNMKISVEKKLMFTANCSCSQLREKQHSWQNNLPLGPDLNPRKSRETLSCFYFKQYLFCPSLGPFTLLWKLDGPAGQATAKKLKIFSGLLISFGQKILWKNIGCFVQGTERGKPENITYTPPPKKKKGFFPFKSIICLLYRQQVLFFQFQSWGSPKTKLQPFHLKKGILESCLCK